MAKLKVDTQMQTADSSSNNMIVRPGEIQSWNEFEVSSVNVNSSYWSPDQGEVRHGIYHGVHIREWPDFNNPNETKELTCAVFHDPVDDVVFMNASAILLSTLARIPIGAALRVEYIGKKKSRSGNQCDNWKINELARKGDE